MALHGINKFIYRLLEAATARALWIALAAYIAMAMVMSWGAGRMNALSGKQVEILDLQPGYTPERVQAILSQYTPEALAFAAWFNLIADTLYPLAYTALFVVIIARLCRKVVPQHPAWRWLLLLPFPIPIIDYLENAGIVQLIWQYPDLKVSTIHLASFFTTLKWGMVGLAALGIITAAVLHLRTRARIRRRAATSYQS